MFFGVFFKEKKTKSTKGPDGSCGLFVSLKSSGSFWSGLIDFSMKDFNGQIKEGIWPSGPLTTSAYGFVPDPFSNPSIATYVWHVSHYATGEMSLVEPLKSPKPFSCICSGLWILFYLYIWYNKWTQSTFSLIWIYSVPGFWAGRSPSYLVRYSLCGPTWSGHQPAEPLFSWGLSSNASQSLCHHSSPVKHSKVEWLNW